MEEYADKLADSIETLDPVRKTTKTVRSRANISARKQVKPEYTAREELWSQKLRHRKLHWRRLNRRVSSRRTLSGEKSSLESLVIPSKRIMSLFRLEPDFPMHLAWALPVGCLSCYGSLRRPIIEIMQPLDQ